MAEPYLDRLSRLLERLNLELNPEIAIEVKHFFSGAALYANGSICGSLSPEGLALKLPDELRHNLIAEGSARKFRFFPKGPIKRGYVALSDSIIVDEEALGDLMRDSIHYVIHADATS